MGMVDLGTLRILAGLPEVDSTLAQRCVQPQRAVSKKIERRVATTEAQARGRPEQGGSPPCAGGRVRSRRLTTRRGERGPPAGS